jgi:superfamily I DNA/RNA helicase
LSIWYDGLNEEQKHAVAHNNGPLLILAGAGSGKTTVLVSRTGRLVDEGIASPKEILVLTFTNKAAREFKERVITKLGKMAKGIWTGTFHSFGLQILKKHYKKARLPKGFGIIDSQDAHSIIKEIIKNIHFPDKDGFDVEKLLSLIGNWRATKKWETDIEDEYEQMAEIILPRYVNKLEQLGVVDFDSLLLKPLELFENEPEVLSYYQDKYSQIMVDEFQDTNKIQMKLIEQISDTKKNLCVVGDDDQSIYGWRGAEIQNILNFPHRYKNCEVVRLVKNYRSTGKILELANAVIQCNKNRHGKVLTAALGGIGDKPEFFQFESEDHESEQVMQQIHYFLRQGYHEDEIALLYRSNSQGGVLEANLRRHMIPYKLTGGQAFFERKEVKDILAYLRCAILPHEVAFRRILNTPHRGLGDKFFEKINSVCEEEELTFYRATKQWQKWDIKNSQGESLEELFEIFRTIKTSLANPENKKSNFDYAAGLLDLINRIGYRDYLVKNTKDGSQFQKRWQMIEVFSRVFHSYMQKEDRDLMGFLEAMDLRDQVQDDDSDEKKVQLMTLHACKGLEFPVVILVGVEEDILPHRSLGQDIDEERRLFYVGVTRAKERLVITRSRYRKRFGQQQKSAASRFILEIPDNLYESFDDGFRPVQEVERKSMLADLYKKLDSKRTS